MIRTGGIGVALGRALRPCPYNVSVHPDRVFLVKHKAPLPTALARSHSFQSRSGYANVAVHWSKTQTKTVAAARSIEDGPVVLRSITAVCR